MSISYQYNKSHLSTSKPIFFAPKFSLQGKNMFPQINQANTAQQNKDIPFLNIFKKPIMSVYQRTAFQSQKKPVFIMGLSKQVQNRNVKTSSIRRNQRNFQAYSNLQTQLSPPFKESLSTCSPVLTKSQMSNIKVITKKVIMPNQIIQGSHFYIIGSGNNHPLMEKIMQRRQGWFPTNNSIYHFRWQQARPKYQNMYPSNKQILNHLPNHEAITDKGNLHQNLKIYCQKNQQYMYKMVPVSFILDFSNSDNIQSQMKKFVQFYWQCINTKMDKSFVQIQKNSKIVGQMRNSKVISTKSNKIEFDTTMDSPGKYKKQTTKTTVFKSSNSKPRNQLNQVDYTRKKQEIKNLYTTIRTNLKPLYNFQDMSNLKKESPYISPMVCDIYGQKNLWLLKPSDLNRGRGIKLFNSIEEFSQLIKNELIRNEKGSFILQKYLQKPMLIEQRKFDIRVYAMITQNKQLYFFKQGYLRISSQKYLLDSKNLFTHLTNNAVQKHATNYGQFAEGNILPLNYLFRNNYMKEDDLRNKMKHLIKTSIKAGHPKLYQINQKQQTISISGNNPSTQKSMIQGNRSKNFEIFGYDFMIDVQKNVWLIEVNTNPCIQLSNKWLSSIIPRMLDDAMKLTLDKIFYRKKCFKQNIQQLNVEGYRLEQNMWELLETQNPQTI